MPQVYDSIPDNPSQCHIYTYQLDIQAKCLQPNPISDSTAGSIDFEMF
jgi:hypothetical protein